MRWFALALILFAAADGAAQTTGAASFRVYEKDALVGAVEMTLDATEDGWRLHGSSRIAGEIPVNIPNLDIYYDKSWGGRFMTLEMKAPDDAIVHVAVVGTVSRPRRAASTIWVPVRGRAR